MPSGFNPGGYITGSDSQLGEAALEAHFGSAVLASTDVVFQMPSPVWEAPAVISRGEDASSQPDCSHRSPTHCQRVGCTSGPTASPMRIGISVHRPIFLPSHHTGPGFRPIFTT